MKVKADYLSGESAEAPVSARSRVDVERRFGMAFDKAFADESVARLDHLYFLAWSALRAAGLSDVEDYDEWLNGVDDVDIAQEPPVRPTKRARKPASSSNSAS